MGILKKYFSQRIVFWVQILNGACRYWKHKFGLRLHAPQPVVADTKISCITGMKVCEGAGSATVSKISSLSTAFIRKILRDVSLERSIHLAMVRCQSRFGPVNLYLS